MDNLIITFGGYGLAVVIFIFSKIYPIIEEHDDRVIKKHDWKKQSDETDVALQEQVNNINSNLVSLRSDISYIKSTMNVLKDDILTSYHHILRYDLTKLLKRCNENEEAIITMEEFTALEKMYSKYRELGGNGTIEKMYDTVKNRLKLTTTSIPFEERLKKYEASDDSVKKYNEQFIKDHSEDYNKEV